jgi:hypothetical protein
MDMLTKEGSTPRLQGGVRETGLQESKDGNFLEAVLWIRIRMFVDLVDPDPLVRCTTPAPNHYVIKQK